MFSQEIYQITEGISRFSKSQAVQSLRAFRPGKPRLLVLFDLREEINLDFEAMFK